MTKEAVHRTKEWKWLNPAKLSKDIKFYIAHTCKTNKMSANNEHYLKMDFESFKCIL